MDPKFSPHTVTSLPVATRDGRPLESTYALNQASVSPSMVMGRDSLGRPNVEPVPTCAWLYMMHPCGAFNKVPIRTGSVYSEQAEAKQYEFETMSELLIEGWIPLHVCPYTSQYQQTTGTRCLVDNPGNEPDCGGAPKTWGAPKGCEHIHTLAAARTAEFRRQHDEDVKRMTPSDPNAANKLMQQMAEAFATMNAQPASEAHTDDIPKRKRPPA